MSFKIATLAEGQEVVEVWSQQHVHGWVQVEPRGYVQYDHLRTAEAAPLATPRAPRRSVGPAGPAEAAGPEELRRAAEAEREDLQRVREELRRARAELQDCREQRDELDRAASQMRAKLEACGEAVKRVVGAVDAVCVEQAGGEAEVGEAEVAEAGLEEAAREAGRDAARLLAELGVDEDRGALAPLAELGLDELGLDEDLAELGLDEDLELGLDEAQEGRTTGAADENALRLSPTPAASQKVFDGHLLDTAQLGERIPLRAIN